MNVKVATKVSPLYSAVETADNEPRGTVSAYKAIQYTGFKGNTGFRRVRVDVEYGVTLPEARKMATDIRQYNEPNSMSCRFTVEL